MRTLRDLQLTITINRKNNIRRKYIKTLELTHQELSVIVGGGCSWNNAAKAALGTNITGLITNGPGGALLGLAGGAVSYGALCWV